MLKMGHDPGWMCSGQDDNILRVFVIALSDTNDAWIRGIAACWLSISAMTKILCVTLKRTLNSNLMELWTLRFSIFCNNVMKIAWFANVLTAEEAWLAYMDSNSESRVWSGLVSRPETDRLLWNFVCILGTSENQPTSTLYSPRW